MHDDNKPPDDPSQDAAPPKDAAPPQDAAPPPIDFAAKKEARAKKDAKAKAKKKAEDDDLIKEAKALLDNIAGKVTAAVHEKAALFHDQTDDRRYGRHA